MKIVFSDYKKGEVKLQVENLDDLWYLSTIIEDGDLVKGETIRKIKIGEEGDRNIKIVKKKAFLSINVEKIEFQTYGNTLRILGVIKDGPEDITRGAHHTINVDIGTTISIVKEEWLNYQKEKLKEASSKEGPKILVCVFDREDALFAQLKKYGFEVLSELKGEVQKKREDVKVSGNFYKQVISQLEDYIKRIGFTKIILASPAFWRDELMKELKNDELKKKIITATCSSVDRGAVNEVLKRPEIKEAVKQDKFSKEIKLVEEILSAISKDGPVCYGYKETLNAANLGAIKILVITDAFIQKKREDDKQKDIDVIMKTADKTGGEINIISSEHEGGKKLDGLGGVAALLRYRVE